jgi:cobalt/nickel transport system permease protein
VSLSRYSAEPVGALQRVDGRVKTVVLLAAVVLASTLSDWRLALALWAGATGLFLTLRFRLRDLLLRLAIPLGVAWLVFLTVLFTEGRHPLFSLPCGVFTLTAWQEGAMRGLLLFLRIMAAVTLATLLAFSTPMIEILETLRVFKIPGVVVDIADMMYRYLFIINDTARTLRRAQLSRLGDSGSWVERVRDIGRVAGGVLIKSLDRSTRIYAAMLARGYCEGAPQMKTFARPVSAADKALGAASAVLLALLEVVNLRQS